MAMRGWCRRSRRDSLGASDTAFASPAHLASALRRYEAARAEHEKSTEQRDESGPACSVCYMMMAEQAGTKAPK